MSTYIGIDIDDVCLDLIKTCFNTYKFLVPEDKVAYENFTGWTFRDNKLLEPKLFYSLFSEISYHTIPAVEYALEGTMLLTHKGYILLFITSYFYGVDYNKKYDRMKNLGFSINEKNYIICKDKSFIDIDYLIDDNPSNLIGNYKGILYDRPWNREVQKDLFETFNFKKQRVVTWKKILTDWESLFLRE